MIARAASQTAPAGRAGVIGQGRAWLVRSRQPLVGLVGGMVAWEIVARIWNVAFFPPFSTVVARLVAMTSNGQIVENLSSSLTNLVLGFALSAAFGLVLGASMGVSRKVDLMFDNIVYALLSAPSLVFAPIFFALFGLNRLSIIGVIFVYTAWIIVINTATAIRTVPVHLVEMGRAYDATRRQLFFEVILPAATPLIMAGLRLGMGRAVKGMINGEMFIAAVGLGAIIIEAEGRFDAASVLAILLLVISVALAATKLVQLVDTRLTGWLPSTAREGRR